MVPPKPLATRSRETRLLTAAVAAGHCHSLAALVSYTTPGERAYVAGAGGEAAVGSVEDATEAASATQPTVSVLDAEKGDAGQGARAEGVCGSLATGRNVNGSIDENGGVVDQAGEGARDNGAHSDEEDANGESRARANGSESGTDNGQGPTGNDGGRRGCGEADGRGGGAGGDRARDACESEDGGDHAAVVDEAGGAKSDWGSAPGGETLCADDQAGSGGENKDVVSDGKRRDEAREDNAAEANGEDCTVAPLGGITKGPSQEGSSRLYPATMADDVALDVDATAAGGAPGESCTGERGQGDEVACREGGAGGSSVCPASDGGRSGTGAEAGGVGDLTCRNEPAPAEADATESAAGAPQEQEGTAVTASSTHGAPPVGAGATPRGDDASAGSASPRSGAPDRGLESTAACEDVTAGSAGSVEPLEYHDPVVLGPAPSPQPGDGGATERGRESAAEAPSREGDAPRADGINPGTCLSTEDEGNPRGSNRGQAEVAPAAKGIRGAPETLHSMQNHDDGGRQARCDQPVVGDIAGAASSAGAEEAHRAAHVESEEDESSDYSEAYSEARSQTAAEAEPEGQDNALVVVGAGGAATEPNAHWPPHRAMEEPVPARNAEGPSREAAAAASLGPLCAAAAPHSGPEWRPERSNDTVLGPLQGGVAQGTSPSPEAPVPPAPFHRTWAAPSSEEEGGYVSVEPHPSPHRGRGRLRKARELCSPHAMRAPDPSPLRAPDPGPVRGAGDFHAGDSLGVEGVSRRHLGSLRESVSTASLPPKPTSRLVGGDLGELQDPAERARAELRRRDRERRRMSRRARRQRRLHASESLGELRVPKQKGEARPPSGFGARAPSPLQSPPEPLDPFVRRAVGGRVPPFQHPPLP